MYFQKKRKKELILIALIFITAISFAGLTACEQKVKAKYGLLRVCKYGEIIQDGTKTLMVPTSQIRKYKITKSIELCSKHKRIEGFYREALESSASGDGNSARDAIEKAAKQDSSIKKAIKGVDQQKQLEKIAATLQKQAKEGSQKIAQIPTTQIASTTNGSNAQQPVSNDQVATQSQTSSGDNAGSSSSEEGSTDASQSNSSQASGSSQTNEDDPEPRELIPASILGYLTGNLNWGDDWANRDYTPPKGSNVESLMIEVIVASSKDVAEKRVKDAQSRLYPNDGDNVTINSTTAYFGTNDSNYASIAFNKNRVFYNVLMLVSQGDPSALRSEAVSIASQIP